MADMRWLQNRDARRSGLRRKATGAFSRGKAAEIRRFHEGLPFYRLTPLVSLDHLAAYLGVKEIRVKDESVRFGLGSFKGLGASYAMAAALAGRMQLPLDNLSYGTVQDVRFKEQRSRITCVTATDGNHGKAVAWLARELGCKAVVYMPAGSSPARFNSIRECGAEVSVIDGNYDDAVFLAEKKALENDWLLIQDTARPGYKEIPLKVMQGYMTLLDEALEQWGEGVPSHVFAQCGVGSFSGSCQAYLAERFGEKRPVFGVVEPVDAACYYGSMVEGDGNAHAVKGPLDTIMAGLACGEPNPLGWEILRDYADMFFSCPDEVTMTAMRILGHPLTGDARVVSGESGAVPLGVLYYLLRDQRYLPAREALGLGKASSVLLFSTEGATDPEQYRKILSAEHPLHVS